MPIKFRCSHCKQFLGISREKAGAIVDCPTCGRSIRVPSLDGTQKPVPPPRLDFEDPLLKDALGELAALANKSPEAGEAEAEQAAQPLDAAEAQPAEPTQEPATGEPIELKPVAMPEPIELPVVEPESVVVPVERKPSTDPPGSPSTQSVDGEDRSEEAVAVEQDEDVPQARETLESSDVIPVESVNAAASSSQPNDAAVDPLDELTRLPRSRPAEDRESAKRVAAPVSDSAASGTSLTWLLAMGFAGCLIGFVAGWWSGTQQAASESETVAETENGGAAGERKTEATPADRAAEEAPVEPVPVAVPTGTAAVSGRVMADGLKPDATARVLLLPRERLGTLRLPVFGVQADQEQADFQVIQNALRLMGGRLDVVDVDGRFEFEGLQPAAYTLVVISQVRPLGGAGQLEAAALKSLEVFFEQPSKVLSQREHHAFVVRMEPNVSQAWVCTLGAEPRHVSAAAEP